MTENDVKLQEAITHLTEILSTDRIWECEACKNDHEQLKEFLEELEQYRSIGTLEECRAAVEC